MKERKRWNQPKLTILSNGAVAGNPGKRFNTDAVIERNPRSSRGSHWNTPSGQPQAVHGVTFAPSNVFMWQGSPSNLRIGQTGPS